MSEEASTNNYGVIELYKSSWETIKKNLHQLAPVAILAVGLSVCVSVFSTLFIIYSAPKSMRDTVVSVIVAILSTMLASVFVGLSQIISLKKATQGTPVILEEVVRESKKYTPRMVLYGLFIVGVIVLSIAMLALLFMNIAVLGGIVSIVFLALLITAAFRYAFLQFTIVEHEKMPFLKRFTLSQKLTDGMYTTILLVAILGFFIGIAGGIVGNVLSLPFKTQTRDVQVIVQDKLTNVETRDEFREALDFARAEISEERIDVAFVAINTIANIVSWCVGLLTLGAFLQLYEARRKELRL